ncbi:RRQRL motif-containing zinc-binding protein [Streptomyces sp. NPDC060209]|uniref:RRQRL motif-containing zinc-binding protein n=1 Tax=Streptomyces sp. NPDC060209 TaxID=3347073 RepID=UPI0036519792
MREMGLRPGGQEPVARIECRGGRRFAWLYRIGLAKPKLPMTLAKEAALDKAMAARQQCPGPCGRRYFHCLPPRPWGPAWSVMTARPLTAPPTTLRQLPSCRPPDLNGIEPTPGTSSAPPASCRLAARPICRPAQLSEDFGPGEAVEYIEAVHAVPADPAAPGDPADTTLCGKPTRDMNKLPYQPSRPDAPWYPRNMRE